MLQKRGKRAKVAAIWIASIKPVVPTLKGFCVRGSGLRGAIIPALSFASRVFGALSGTVETKMNSLGLWIPLIEDGSLKNLIYTN